MTKRIKYNQSSLQEDIILAENYFINIFANTKSGTQKNNSEILRQNNNQTEITGNKTHKHFRCWSFDIYTLK